MPEMQQCAVLDKPGFTYSACGSFKKDKACFQHDMTYGDFKDLAKRTASDKVSRDKAFNIAKNPKYDGYQRGLASVVYKFFDKKFALLADKSTAGGVVKSKHMLNQQLAEELHKPIIKNLKIVKYIHHLKTISGVLI